MINVGVGMNVQMQNSQYPHAMREIHRRNRVDSATASKAAEHFNVTKTLAAAGALSVHTDARREEQQ